MKKPSKPNNPAPRAGKTARAAVAPAAAGPSQTELFAQASTLFQAGRFAEAKGLFEAALEGASREMAHAAGQRVRMCEQRIATAGPAPATAEEHYNYAVALMNRADFQAARQHLEQALQTASAPDHIHYSLALCLGSLGDIDGACRHLKRAIEIHPRNRAMARNDPDFAALAHRSPISELLAGGPGRF